MLAAPHTSAKGGTTIPREWPLASGFSFWFKGSPLSWPLTLLSPRQALSNRGQHSISYTLSRSHSVIVEYTHDSDTDMFQVCSGPSARLLATSLSGRLYTPSRGRLEDRRPWGRCFGGLSAVDLSSDEEAGHPSKGHTAGSRCIRVQTPDRTPQLWEDIQFRDSEWRVRVTPPGSGPSSMAY